MNQIHFSSESVLMTTKTLCINSWRSRSCPNARPQSQPGETIATWVFNIAWYCQEMSLAAKYFSSIDSLHHSGFSSELSHSKSEEGLIFARCSLSWRDQCFSVIKGPWFNYVMWDSSKCMLCHLNELLPVGVRLNRGINNGGISLSVSHFDLRMFRMEDNMLKNSDLPQSMTIVSLPKESPKHFQELSDHPSHHVNVRRDCVKRSSIRNGNLRFGRIDSFPVHALASHWISRAALTIGKISFLCKCSLDMRAEGTLDWVVADAQEFRWGWLPSHQCVWDDMDKVTRGVWGWNLTGFVWVSASEM
jgi:hypothetical protein